MKKLRNYPEFKAFGSGLAKTTIRFGIWKSDFVPHLSRKVNFWLWLFLRLATANHRRGYICIETALVVSCKITKSTNRRIPNWDIVTLTFILREGQQHVNLLFTCSPVIPCTSRIKSKFKNTRPPQERNSLTFHSWVRRAIHCRTFDTRPRENNELESYKIPAFLLASPLQVNGITLLKVRTRVEVLPVHYYREGGGTVHRIPYTGCA